MIPKRPQRIRSVGELPAPVDWIRRSVGELPAPVDRIETIVVLSAMYSGCISSFCCSRIVSDVCGTIDGRGGGLTMTPKRPQRIRSVGELPAPVDWIRRSVGELPAPVDRINTIVVLSAMHSGCISSFCCSRIVSDVCGTIDGRSGGLTDVGWVTRVWGLKRSGAEEYPRIRV